MPIDIERRNRICGALAKAGLNAVVSASASDVLLLTGYWPVMGTSVAVFTADGDVRIVLPEDEQDLASKTTDATLIAYKPELLHRLTGPLQEIHTPLSNLLDRLGLHHATVGVPMQLTVQPASYAVVTEFRQSLHRLLGTLLPDASVVGCDDVLEDQRAVKTTQELLTLQTAATIAARGFAVAPEAVRPGLRETEVASRFQAAFETAVGAEAVERSYGFFFCMSGPNSAKASAAYARTRQRRLEIGDLVMIHANTCADGFWTDITRTYTVGPAVARQEEMRTAVDAARHAALAAIRPGVVARDVDKAARSVMEAHGMGKAFKHAAGHGVGFAAANANALPRIHPASPDVLETGMTFNIEPAAYFDGYGGMRHCDVVAVTSEGYKVLTDL